MDKKVAKIVAYCTECGRPQVFSDEAELRIKIAEQKTCECGAKFGFLADGRIWNLRWDEIPLINNEQREKVYEVGQSYDFYKDIRSIIQNAKTGVFLIDAYVNEEALNLYLESMPNSVKIRILTKKPQGNFLTVAKKFKAKPAIAFEVKQSNDIHDRVLFVDDLCFVMGQSLLDAAAKKPTYLIRIENIQLRELHERLWASASTIV
jgi:hypothetical protein